MPMGDIRMTEEQFQAAITAASEAGARAAVSAVQAMPHAASGVPTHLADLLPKQQNEEEAYAAALKRPVADRSAQKQERIQCQTARGATFTAVVTFHRDEDGKPHPLWPHGRVVQLSGYKEPEFTTEGKPDSLVGPGLYCVPKGMPMTNTGSGRTAGQETTQFKNWRWHAFMQADFGRYVGGDPRELPRHVESHDRAAE